MRFDLRSGVQLALLAMSLLLAASLAQAKTSKFDRSGTKSKTQNLEQTDAAPADASKTAKKDDAANAKPGDKKVDITDLENRYWTAKDTEFSVVQNRLYTKAKKFSVTPEFGVGLNDPYENNVHFGLALSYYFSEREGLELQAWKTSASDADLINRIGSNGAVPDRNIQQGYIGINYVWVPIYAKLSLLEKKILYFDMGLAPGLGVTMLNAGTYTTSTSIAPPSSASQTQLTLAADIYQQIFLSEHWAIKADLKNHFYQEKIFGATSGNQLSTKTNYQAIIMFGVTFFQ